MLVHKFYLIAWLELDSNLFEFNRFEFEFEKEKGKEKKRSKPASPAQPASFLSLGPALFPRGPLSPSPLPHAAQPARSPARVLLPLTGRPHLAAPFSPSPFWENSLEGPEANDASFCGPRKPRRPSVASFLFSFPSTALPLHLLGQSVRV
jgi:hypothetical protein